MTRPSSDPAGWSALLDRLEDSAVAVEEAAVRGTLPPLPSWVPPADLGPLPDELRSRADAVLDRLRRAHGRGQERVARLGDELAGLDRRRRAGAAYARGATRTA